MIRAFGVGMVAAGLSDWLWSRSWVSVVIGVGFMLWGAFRETHDPGR